MKSVKKRLNDILMNLSGFKDEKDRQQAIQYLKSIDPDIKSDDIVTVDDYMNELKSFFAPLPNTEAWDNWLGTDQHKKYLKRQKQKQKQEIAV